MVFEGLIEVLGEAKIMHQPGVSFDEDALAAIAAADAAVLVVGLTSAEEGEGFIAAGDRQDLAIPPEQEQLILDVAAVQPRTIVVLEGGSSITTEAWIDRVPAVWMAWYPGMEGGHAIADLILGLAEPSGRLPVTFPRSMDQLPSFDNVSLSVAYDLWHGYRHMLREGTEPRFAFGYGQSYTTWDLADLTLPVPSAAPGASATVEVSVTNTGDRPGIQTIQVYAEAPAASLERPPRWLVGFSQVQLAAGEQATVSVDVPTARLAAWDESTEDWTYEPNTFILHAGTSSTEVSPAGTLTIEP
jgi:beta-glucosidase